MASRATGASALLRQPPVQAESRADLRAKLAVEAGGVVFTTIQKFLPEEKGDRHPVLSERRNIVVIADEAHRSQYDFIDGFARHMRDALPHASFIGFTGTPIEKTDANTRAVFGDYISVYDIQRAVEDRATVPIYYESRLAKLALEEAERPKIDPDFEEVTEGEEVERKEKLKSKWAQLEAIVGAEKRLKLIARDIVEHFVREGSAGYATGVCEGGQPPPPPVHRHTRTMAFRRSRFRPRLRYTDSHDRRPSPGKTPPATPNAPRRSSAHAALSPDRGRTPDHPGS